MPSALLHELDAAIITIVTAPANRWPLLDQLLAALDRSTLLRGGLFVAVLCWLWAEALRRGKDAERLVVRMVIGFVAALVVGRAAQTLAPYRPRPLMDPTLAIAWPLNPDADALHDWSSMPSDHAIYFVALATAFCFRSRLLGAVAIAWTVLIALLPRIYFGQHYPSDIVVGAAIGALIALAAMTIKLPPRLLDLPGRLATRFPAPFYALAMLVALQMATMFFETREWIHRAGVLARALRDSPTEIAPAAAGPQAELPRPGAPPAP